MEDKLYEQIAELVDKAGTVNYTIQLPDTEYDVMCAVWEGTFPLTTAWLMQEIGNLRGWKTPALDKKMTLCLHTPCFHGASCLPVAHFQGFSSLRFC